MYGFIISSPSSIYILSVYFQFVPFRDFIGVNQDLQISQARLAKEVLAEIPDQFLSFMKSKGIKPRPPLVRQDTVSSVESSVASSAPPGQQPPPPAYSEYRQNSVAAGGAWGRQSAF